MLYLVHENGAGEPVGVHNEAGQSAYRRDAGYFQADGARTVAAKPESQDWRDFAEEKATTFNPMVNYHTQDLPEGEINDVLAQVITSNKPAQ